MLIAGSSPAGSATRIVTTISAATRPLIVRRSRRDIAGASELPLGYAPERDAAGPSPAARVAASGASLAFRFAPPNTPRVNLSVTQLTDQLLASYARVGGINHLDGKNLPSKTAITGITLAERMMSSTVMVVIVSES